MNDDFFTQLEAELGTLTRNGVHLVEAGARERRRLIALIRRSLVIIALAVALGASFDSEFPATARGSAAALRSATQRV